MEQLEPPSPLYRRRATLLLGGYALIYGLTMGVWCIQSWFDGASLIVRLGAFLGPAALLAPVMLLLLLAAFGIRRRRPWGRWVGFWMAGLIGLLAFPYGVFASIPLFGVLLVGWPPVVLPRVMRDEAPELPASPPPSVARLSRHRAPAHQLWNNRHLRRFKRAKPRSR